jgi:hypothetical protein
MLASRIMQKQQRTTVSASSAALGTLEAEARRRGVPVSMLLREAVEEKARALRSGRRPRVGVARSVDGLGAADVAGEPIAEPPR